VEERRRPSPHRDEERRERDRRRARRDEERRRVAEAERRAPERPRTERRAPVAEENSARSGGERNLLGTWRGTHTGQPATLVITRRSGNSFSGMMTVRTAHGPVRVAVAGAAARSGGPVTLRETRVIGGRRDAWDLGSNVGRVRRNGQIAGTGRDRRNRPYSWSFSR